MKRIEAWGAELALALRAEADALAEAMAAGNRADEASARVNEIKKRIVSASNEETWMSTAEFQAVVDARVTEQIPRMEDVPCPGHGYCSWWGRPHAHLVDGKIYDLSFQVGKRLPPWVDAPTDWSS